MARTRNIKPAFFDNDTLGSLDPLIRLLFIGLWCIADRDGRLEDRPLKIKKMVLGYDDVTAEEADEMLQQLADNGFIIRYTANDIKYIQIVTFTKHQNPNMKEKASEIPPPPSFPNGSYAVVATEETTGSEQQSDQQSATPRMTPRQMDEQFEAFWNEYPRKKSKETARRAWAKISPNEAMYHKIMDAVARAKQGFDWTKDNGRWIPNPANWLDGGCWEDEISPAPPPSQGGGDTNTMSALRTIIAEEEGITIDES